MSLHWPATSADLQKAGWKFAGWGKCRACGRKIAWARTPAERAAPLEATPIPRQQAALFNGPRYSFEPHFAHCPAAVEFRRKRCVQAGNAIVCFR